MENKKDNFSIVVLIGICFFAAFGPGLIVNKFYLKSLQPDWVQAISSILAVVVALFLPYCLRLREYKQQEKESIDRELVALHTIYEELLCFHLYFMQVRSMFADKNYAGLVEVLSGTHPNDPRPSEVNSREVGVIVSALRSELAVDYVKLIRSRNNIIKCVEGMVAHEQGSEELERSKDYFSTVEASYAEMGKIICEKGTVNCKNILQAAHHLDDSFLVPNIRL